MKLSDKTWEELKWCVSEAKRLLDISKDRTKKFQRASYLARSDQKDSKEFKELERFIKDPTVIDFGNVIERLAALNSKINKE